MSTLARFMDLELPEPLNKKLTLVPREQLCRGSNCAQQDLTLEVHKGILCFASSVFRSMIEIDPDCTSIEVDGGYWEWNECLKRSYPLPASAVRPLSSDQVLSIVPIAHKYDFTAVLNDCTEYAHDFNYNNRSAIQFVQMAARLQFDDLARGAFKHIMRAAKIAASPIPSPRIDGTSVPVRSVVHHHSANPARTNISAVPLGRQKSRDQTNDLMLALQQIEGVPPLLEIALSELGHAFGQ